jgi:GNAT superfamily N-acetyltransferase
MGAGHAMGGKRVMQPGTEVSFRRFAARDVPAARRLSAAVGWAHREEDWEFVRALGSGWVALAQGEVRGTALTWRHDARHGSLGMVIVEPAWQGRGLGRALVERALATLGSRSLMLNGTLAGRTMYERMGFRVVGTLEQHQGVSGNVPPTKLGRDERLRPVGPNDVPRLVKLGLAASGIRRAKLIRALLDVSEGIALDRGDETLGFALCRRFGHGRVIGPVVAPDAVSARALIGHWVAVHAGTFLRTDVDRALGLGPWLTELGLPEVDAALTMVRGEAPSRRGDVTAFSVVNQALG